MASQPVICPADRARPPAGPLDSAPESSETRSSSAPARAASGLEGAVCVPSAWRRKWKTTSRRTIGVMAIRIAGSSVISVRTSRIVHGVESDGMQPGIQIGQQRHGGRRGQSSRAQEATMRPSPRPALPAQLRAPGRTRSAHPAHKMPARPRARWPPGNAAPRPRPEPATGAGPAQSAPPAPAAAAARRRPAAAPAASPPARQSPPSFRSAFIPQPLPRRLVPQSLVP